MGVVSDFADIASRFVNHDKLPLERLDDFPLALDECELIDLPKVIGFYAAIDLHHFRSEHLTSVSTSDMELVVKELF